MKRDKALNLVLGWGAAAVLAACGPFAGPAGAGHALTVRIDLPGLAAQAVAKRPKDVVTYQVTLVAAGTSTPVVLAGNPASVSAPMRTATFANVPAGTYEVLVDALDGAVHSLAQGGQPVRSTTQATLGADGTVGVLAVTLNLADATAAAPRSATVTIAPDMYDFQPDRYGVALVNNASRQVTPRAVADGFRDDTNPAIADGSNEAVTIADVQDGAPSGATHEFWAFQVDSHTNLATIAKPYGTAPDANGLISDVTAAIAAAQLNNASPQAVSLLPGLIGLDKDNALYFADAAGIKRAPAPAYDPPADVVSLAGIAGMAVDRDGRLYCSTGTDIKQASPPAYGTPATVVTAAHVGVMAIDDDRNLYWRDTGTGHIMKAEFDGFAGYERPVDTGIGAGPTSRIAANAYGDLYFISGNTVQRSVLNDNRTAYAAPQAVVDTTAEAGTAKAVTELTVDRAGNVYFVSANLPHQIRMAPAGGPGGAVYVVAGTGTPNPESVFSVPEYPQFKGIQSPANLVVGVTGSFFFTSAGTGGTGSYLRRM